MVIFLKCKKLRASDSFETLFSIKEMKVFATKYCSKSTWIWSLWCIFWNVGKLWKWFKDIHNIGNLIYFHSVQVWIETMLINVLLVIQKSKYRRIFRFKCI